LGLSDEAAAVIDAIEPLITKVLMPVAGRAVPGFKGKALVKTALEVLLAVMRGPVAAQEEWSQVWAAIGGTFWLSRWVCAAAKHDMVRQTSLLWEVARSSRIMSVWAMHAKTPVCE
jgi:hypothetical protein